jgi:hypothetical protein
MPHQVKVLFYKQLITYLYFTENHFLIAEQSKIKDRNFCK